LVSQYPQLAEDFLSKIGAVKTFVGVDVAQRAGERHGAGPETVIPLKCCLSEECGFLVAGADSLVPVEDLWGGSLADEVLLSCSLTLSLSLTVARDPRRPLPPQMVRVKLRECRLLRVECCPSHLLEEIHNQSLTPRDLILPPPAEVAFPLSFTPLSSRIVLASVGMPRCALWCNTSGKPSVEICS
jgi:hypothetical protein